MKDHEVENQGLQRGIKAGVDEQLWNILVKVHRSYNTRKANRQCYINKYEHNRKEIYSELLEFYEANR